MGNKYSIYRFAIIPILGWLACSCSQVNGIRQVATDNKTAVSRKEITEGAEEKATPMPIILPPDPIKVAFSAADGQELEGTFFPGVSDASPLVVLMHWARSDQYDWYEIAAWLQNRGYHPSGGTADYPWRDASWYPDIPEGLSFAVFTFTFRNCQGGCQSFLRDKWLLDAQAAMDTAREQPGVDAHKVVAVGASIGADGSADSCLWLNEKMPDTCQGAFSISPGDYLTQSFIDTAVNLGSQKPVWCLYGKEDQESNRVCAPTKSNYYRPIEYDNDLHGMMLIQPQSDPNVLELLLEFLSLTVLP